MDIDINEVAIYYSDIGVDEVAIYCTDIGVDEVAIYYWYWSWYNFCWYLS